MDTARRRMLAWAGLVVVYLVWGSTYLAIRVGVRDFPPIVLVGARYLIAGALLLPVALRMPEREGAPRDPIRPAHWFGAAVVGGLLLVVGNGGVTLAERSVPSGLAAVLVATVPIWTVVLARPIRHERITAAAGLGVLLGLAGVVVLVGPGADGAGFGGVATILVAAAGWALGSVLSHVVPLPSRAIVAAAMQMLVAGSALVVAGLLGGAYSNLHWSQISGEAWWALVWLVLPGSILAFTAYAFVLTELPLPVVSTYAYVNPVVAVLLGSVLLGERFALHELIGAAIVVGSVAVTMNGRHRRRSITTPQQRPARSGPPDPARPRAETSPAPRP
jgi:drug/metabolite transporter (DMT)-like permease